MALDEIVQSRTDEAFRLILNKSAMNTPDGQPVASFARLRGFRSAEQITGRNLVCDVVSRDCQRGGIAFYEGTIAMRRLRSVTISIVALGAILRRAAFAYICGQPKIESIVSGTSS